MVPRAEGRRAVRSAEAACGEQALRARLPLRVHRRSRWPVPQLIQPLGGRSLPGGRLRQAAEPEGKKTAARFCGRRLIASFIKTENGPYLCCSLILAKHSLQ